MLYDYLFLSQKLICINFGTQSTWEKKSYSAIFHGTIGAWFYVQRGLTQSNYMNILFPVG